MYIAGYVVPKTIILKMTGIMSSGIAPGYIADKAHTAITNAKGSIIPKDSMFYTLLSIQVVRDVLNFFSFNGNSVYQSIHSYGDKICANVRE